MTVSEVKRYTYEVDDGVFAECVLGEDYDAAQSELAALRALKESLFPAVAHGDDAHRAWLAAAIDAHFSGSPAPEYVASGKDVELAALREELATAKRVGPPHFCGLPMSLNPHPEAGVPGRILEVGTVRECIPCLVSSRHGWAKTAGDLQQRLTAAEQRNAELIECAEELADLVEASLEGDYKADSFTTQPIRNALANLKPTESGASE